jgi:hypothetical protein
MHDPVDPPMRPQQPRHGVGVGQVQLVEGEGARRRIAGQRHQPRPLQRRIVVGIEVVEPDHRLAARQQGAAEMRADEAGRAGHQDMAHAQRRPGAGRTDIGRILRFAAG